MKDSTEKWVKRFDELISSQKQLDKWLSAFGGKLVECIGAQNKQMMDNLTEQVGKQIIELKEHIYAKFDENKEVKLNQVIGNKVGDFVKEGETLSNCDTISERNVLNNDDNVSENMVVSENYIMNSDDEILVGVKISGE